MGITKITEKIYLADRDFNQDDIAKYAINHIYVIPGPDQPWTAVQANISFADCLITTAGYVENTNVPHDEMMLAIGAAARSIAFNSVMDSNFHGLIFRGNPDGVERVLIAEALTCLGLTREDIREMVWNTRT